MFTPRRPAQVPVDPPRAQALALGPRTSVAFRLLLAATLVSLGLCALSNGTGAAYASNPPVVTGVSPKSGPVAGGTTVNITGVDFTGATAVEFGSTKASGVTVNSGGTSITAVSPAVAVAGKVHVRVTTPEGISQTSSTDTFKFTPTVTNVSPNTGPPAGGTTVTVTGTGFAVGATILKIGPRRAVSVSCTTTTKCTAITPELVEGAYVNPAHVTATVGSINSPHTSADLFDYHGLYLKEERRRLPVGAEVRPYLKETLVAEGRRCNANLRGTVALNGETTDEIDTRAEEPNCLALDGWSGVLHDGFALRLGADGKATVEGAMGLRTPFGCVYEGHMLSGGFEVSGFPFNAGLGGTFTLVAEEEPGAECSATESVFMGVGVERGLYTELVG
jgi:hypothetical protein